MTLAELLNEPERAFLPPDSEKVRLLQEKEACRRAIVQLRPSKTCEGCGKKAKTEGHHPGYSPELRKAVIWLCKTCHSKVTGRMTRRNNANI